MLIFYHGDMDGIAAANIYLENITYATETKIKHMNLNILF